MPSATIGVRRHLRAREDASGDDWRPRNGSGYPGRLSTRLNGECRVQSDKSTYPLSNFLLYTSSRACSGVVTEAKSSEATGPIRQGDLHRLGRGRCLIDATSPAHKFSLGQHRAAGRLLQPGGVANSIIQLEAGVCVCSGLEGYFTTSFPFFIFFSYVTWLVLMMKYKVKQRTTAATIARRMGHDQNEERVEQEI